MKTSIRVFQTHIEVYPYSKGDSERLEKSLSKFDKAYHKWYPISYYISDNTLYLPKGISLNLLQREFNSLPIPISKADEYEVIKKGKMLVEPKSSMQEDAINFLTTSDRFHEYKGKSQFMLNLDTGDGKTVAAISAILKLKYRAIIIVHQNEIKEQWINTIKEKTSVKEDRILNIEGSSVIENIFNGKIKPDYDFFIVNHQTLNSYARDHSWDEIRELFKVLKIGIKVIDEAHLFFENIMKVDFFSNTLLSFYLTATFGRSDVFESKLYKRSFGSVVRFGEETFNYDDKRKHINLIITYFRSHPTNGYINVRTKMGFSAYKYIDYEIHEQYDSLVCVLKKILTDTSHMDGKVLIISPKIDSAEFFAKIIKKHTGKEVGTIHSNNSEEVNKANEEKKFISSTPKSLGTGVDLKGLRIIINLEPMGRISMDQLRGRLREYSSDKETFLFYPIDTSIPEVVNMLKRAMPMFKEKCKSIVALNID